MSFQFHCVLMGMEVSSATSSGLSFVITVASRRRAGYVASGRPVYVSKTAINIAGSPFHIFADAEEVCNATCSTFLNSQYILRTLRPALDPRSFGHRKPKLHMAPGKLLELLFALRTVNAVHEEIK